MKKYILGLLLSIISILIPMALIYIGLITLKAGFFIAAGVFVLIYFMARRFLVNILADGRQEIEYDEFGRSKRKNIKMLSRKEQDAIDLQRTADLERLLSTAVITKITKQGSKEPEKDLDKMIGLIDVKTKIKEMAARMSFEKESNKNKRKKDRINSMSGRHMVFYGSAGTGKTASARIITGYLYKYGYIKKNKCVEVDGNFLKAGEETATKVKMITQHAYDGVLFIDEAYVLAEGQYGNEAVATLIKELEDHRDRFICILAGYTKDMNKLLESNSGFKSRIKEYLNFPDYTIQEMQSIFTLMANEQNFAVSEKAYKALEIRLHKEMQLKTFGNARTVRNILDEAIDKHSYNYVSHNIPEVDKYKLTEKDISTAIKREGIT